MHKHARQGVWRHAPPGNFLKSDCSEISEIASEAILGQKQSRSSYDTGLVENCIRFLAVHVCIILLSRQTWNFHERILRLAKQQVR